MELVMQMSMWLVIWGVAAIAGHMIGRVVVDDYRGTLWDSVVVGIGLALVLTGQFIEPLFFISLSGLGLGVLIVSLITQTKEARSRDKVLTGVFMGLGCFLILAGQLISRIAPLVG